MGARDRTGAARVVGTGLWLFAAVSLLLSLVLIVGARLLCEFLNVPESASEASIGYLRICGVGIVFIVLFNFFSGLFTGLGDSKTPLIFVATAAAANIIGDYLLVGLCGKGAWGAAWATVASQCLSVLIAMAIIRRKLPFRLTTDHFQFNSRLTAKIVKLGFPIALQNACNELSYLLIIGFVNALGVTASSGVGIAEKLVMFILLIPTAFMLSVSAFVSHHQGAGLEKRSVSILTVGLFTSLAIGSLTSWLSYYEGHRLALLFIRDETVISAAAEFLRATSIECFFFAFTYPLIGYLMGCGQTGFVMLQGLLAIFLIRIPYAWWASTKPVPDLFDIGLSTGLAAGSMALLCTVFFIRLLRKKGSAARH